MFFLNKKCAKKIVILAKKEEKNLSNYVFRTRNPRSISQHSQSNPSERCNKISYIRNLLEEIPINFTVITQQITFHLHKKEEKSILAPLIPLPSISFLKFTYTPVLKRKFFSVFHQHKMNLLISVNPPSVHNKVKNVMLSEWVSLTICLNEIALCIFRVSGWLEAAPHSPMPAFI